MKFFNTGNIIIIIIILFVLGLSVGVYNGDELKYNGFMINNSNSTINSGISKIIDGGLTIGYEIANIVGKGAIEKGVDLNKIVDWFIILFWVGIVLTAFASLVKVFLYVYVINSEMKIARREKKMLGIEDDDRLREMSKIEKRNRIWYYIIGGLILFLILIIIII